MNSMRKNPTKLYTVESVVHSSSNLSQPLIRSLKKGMTFQHFPIQIYDENQWKTTDFEKEASNFDVNVK